MTDGRGVSALERIESILANPEIHELAAVVPIPPRHHGGRPRHYPAFMVIVYEGLISVYGSARQVEAELAHPALWRWICRIAYERAGVRLPDGPMRRHHYLYLRDRYLTDDKTLDLLGDIHRRAAARQATDIGLLRADGAGSWTHPSLDRLIHGDGKVVTPLYRARPGETRLNRDTGELRHLRSEPDAALHFEGTGETVWGTKFVLLATRGQPRHSRIVLDVAYVSTKGGEAATALTCLQRTAPHAPGAQAIIYDTALRGVHHQTIMRDLGLLPINRVAAAKASSNSPRRDPRDQRTEKLVFVETKALTATDGTQPRVDLYARGGTIGIGTITVRLHADASDAARKFNRTENVRPIPPDDPGFAKLFQRRNDAESINRNIEDSLWIGRAHSLGHRRQTLNLLGYALMVNSLALARHQRPTALAA